MSRSAALKVQMWGNSLAVRLPAAIARSANLTAGQPEEITVEHGVISIVRAGARELTLSQRLAAYDVERHGGEVMATGLRGNERM